MSKLPTAYKKYQAKEVWSEILGENFEDFAEFTYCPDTETGTWLYEEDDDVYEDGTLTFEGNKVVDYTSECGNPFLPRFVVELIESKGFHIA